MPNVYTRTGDKGDTGLFGGSRVPKQSLRVEAYGTVDEANAALGAAKAMLPAGQWRRRVHDVQQRLFVLAAELASDPEGAAILANKINAEDITDLEHLIDDCLAVTGPQREFVVPGRDDRSGAFHQARTVVRRAERRVLTLAETEPVRPELIKYLNRLSDAVYSLARLAETWRDEEIERIVRDAVAKVLGTPSKQAQPDREERAARVEATPSKPVEPDHEPLGEQSAPAPSRGRTPVRRFDLAAAKRIAERAEARSAELGVPVVIAAADAGGNLMLLHRIEGALLASIEIAINKAWSAVAFQAPTATLGPLATGDGPLPGLADTNSGRVVLFGGGVPVHVDGELAGAIGISGGTAEQDVDIATCALQDWNTIGEQ
ncbi:cob(I)yrinic acid a,c-diamide adenosyltransferase [Arachnia propionica]|uniref:Corrinoid adenosyltransferase n=1 Tax=Arachnia propionica TaxID=1750 RepID=A0AB37I544_9ACTN|nr:cob(I)yrinic acid a,c-diamide adenosyltransferase [Arachnia propionica]AFN46395.1 ATP:cob(I)alamin adenosyltransferase [Arachnia propionica F0230a]QCT39042.1 cob(I)yrinic acid a,c-diamide adenosyltransferase [Arachnia propionica]QUC11329.1 cob(I)yrinic acid a,c-diamide adenosyltransferase [Arachnia propionica]RPA18179.1 cob(I)yrinic acid a,c-diamide adenosyltransferase [Arachnia propionica]